MKLSSFQKDFYLALIVYVFANSLNLCAMERPHISQAIYVNNKEIQLANYKALLAGQEAVRGCQVDPEDDFPIEGISPEILSASPKELADYFKQWGDDRIELLLLDRGITPEMVAAQNRAARMCLHISLHRAKEKLEKPSDIVEQEAKKVARDMEVSAPEVFIMHGKNARLIGGSVVAYSPEKLHQLAPTPRRIKAVLAHELVHRKKQDALHKLAIRKAFEEAGKEEEYADELADEVSRIKEATCDFTGASLSREYAEHFERLWDTPDRKTVATTHPLHMHRKKMASSLVAVHRLHDEKKVIGKSFFSEAGKRLRELVSEQDVSPDEC